MARRTNILAKTWSADNPKAALMDKKRAVIVAAAMDAFLDAGYAEASVNHIAAAAGVSIKTLYRHYDSKDDLFRAVMHAACGDVGRAQGERAQRPRPDWYDRPPSVALPQAGLEFLKHVLLPKQVALYRVVMRDAPRFPELGRQYLEEVVAPPLALFAGYLDFWSKRQGWMVHDKLAAARAFTGLLKAGIFDRALFENEMPDQKELRRRAADASKAIQVLLSSGRY
jgi:AcrR family transcriptional regulator